MSGIESWQAEADLLAEGREHLERLCSTTRYRHLFPTGPNLALLLRAYQDVDRWRTVMRLDADRPRIRRRIRRRFRRRLKQLVREDALARDRRLIWRYPQPRAQPLRVDPPAVVLEALLEVDADARRDVAATIHGRERKVDEASGDDGEPSASSTARSSRVEGRLHRGLQQFREALINAALAHPRQIPRLHPQYLQFAAAPQPTRRKHPIATMLLVKLPLQLLMILVLLFNLAYLGAYYFFNDERLGGFVSARLGAILDGDLIIESIHWTPMLIVDLFTGQPHELQVYKVSVHEAYKLDDDEQGQRTAYAEHLEAELVMHEIIPWNRLGVPKLVEIPWVLHFAEVRNKGELWVDVRAYKDEDRGEEWMLSLIDAFETIVDLSPPPELKKLSYRVDHAEVDGLTLRLDLEERSGWATTLDFEDIEFALDFEAWAPIEGRPETLPLAYQVDAAGGEGSFTIAPIHEGPMPIESLDRLEIASGMSYRPIGDLWLEGEAALGGSPTVFRGRLLDVFGEIGFDFRLATTNMGPLGEILIPAKPDDEGRMRSMLGAEGAPATLEVKGPLAEVELEAVGQGLTLDLFPDPSWAIHDVDVSLSLAEDPLPELWAGVDHPALKVPTATEPGALEFEGQVSDPDAGAAGQVSDPGASGEGEAPGEDEPDDGQRWIVYLDTFRGSAFGGSVRLHRRGRQDHVVLPKGELEPLLVSIYLDLIGVNLGELALGNPELAAMISGQSDGGLQIHQVIIDDEGLDRVEAELHRLDIQRDYGPEDDHLPRKLLADGEAIWDAEEGLDLRGMRLGVDGGQLRLSGGVDADFERLKPSSVSVRVDNGERFLAAFGLPRWFDTLAADFNAAGPLTNPRGSGTLDITGAGAGALAVDDVEAASLRFEGGTLSVRSPDVAMLGGHGPLEAELGLLANGKALEDPRLRLALRLEDINRDDILGSGIGAENAAIELVIDDGDGGSVRLSELHARGGAYAETLRLAGVDYRNAEASFAFTRDGIEIDRMNLAYHRPVSPALRADVTVPVGRVTASGRVGFAEDPSLDLEVEASNVPLSALAQSLGPGLPLRGQISRGSRLGVSGSLRRPEVEGQLVLSRLGAAGVPLGGGVLEFSSVDEAYQPGDPEAGRAATAAHRQIRVGGKLSSPGRGGPQGEGELDWRVDATVAFGGGRDNPIEAAVDLRFDSLPLDNLLSHPTREKWRTHVIGGLHGLLVEARYCPSHEGEQMPLLGQCATLDPDDPRELAGEPLRVDMRMEQLWYRGRRGDGAVSVGTDPCLDGDTTCSLNPLVARLDGSRLSLDEPWQIQSGGRQGSVVTVDGTFDLSGDDTRERADDERNGGGAQGRQGSERCIPGVPDNASLPPGSTAATIEGALDFAALAPFLSPWGVASPDGHLDLALDLTGVVTRPTVTGYVRLPKDGPIELSLDPGGEEDSRRRTRSIPVEVSRFDLAMAGGTVYVNGAVKVFDEVLSFGEIGNKPSFLDLAGPCSGRYALRAAGVLDGAVIHRLLPGLIEGSGGGVGLQDFEVAGDLANFSSDEDDTRLAADEASEAPPAPAKPYFDLLRGTLSFERKALRLATPELGEARLASGIVEIRQCTEARPCGRRQDAGRRSRGIMVWLSGRRSANSQSAPSDALNLRVGDRGRAQLWGELILDDRFTGLERASLTAAGKMFPISLADNSGRPELEAELSSDRILFETDGQNGRVSGKVLVERSAWLRDARQGVAVLSFADPSPAPPSQLPPFIRGLELDIELETGAPFRVDNNVAKKLEASADLRLGGTIGDPDLNGTIVVERGVIDVDILGGAYDVAAGKIGVDNNIAQSEINLLATRQKPIKINNQLLTLQLRLSGTLDAIQWECSAPGDTSGALATTRGCVDYLIFDAGNTDLAKSDIRETRSNNNLLGTRFLPLAGRLTQVEINEVLEREIPRVESYLPYVRFRVDQLGVLIEAETRPEWLRWGWGRLGLNFTYLRGYPGSVIRESRSVSGILEILENTAIETSFGNRNYSNRVLILDPPRYRSIQFIQRLELPSAR